MYKLTSPPSTTIIRIADGAFIPANPENPDYSAYLVWVSEGNTPQPATTFPSIIPAEVTMRQARLALLEAGLLTTVETAIASMSGPVGEAARIEWEYSSTMKRTQPLVLALGAQLGLSETDLDNLFLSASQK
jgi:hypothetical protein